MKKVYETKMLKNWFKSFWRENRLFLRIVSCLLIVYIIYKLFAEKPAIFIASAEAKKMILLKLYDNYYACGHIENKRFCSRHSLHRLGDESFARYINVRFVVLQLSKTYNTLSVRSRILNFKVSLGLCSCCIYYFI